jgi:glycosyltransferase involved in cell wall biosynthesis
METHLKSLADAIAGVVDLRVLVASDRARSRRGVVDGIDVTRVGTITTIASAPICPRLPYYIRSSPADVIHIHVPHPTAIMAYFASGTKIPLVLTYHSDIVRQKLLAKPIRPIMSRALKAASTIICTSPQYRDSSPDLKPHRDRCEIIPFGIEVERFDKYDPHAVSKLRNQYGPHLILAVGRLVYYKGFHHLIRSMRQIHAHLLIVGQGPLEHSLKQSAAELGVANKVTFLGGLEDLVPYYRAADVFVLPSIARSEAFGIVQLEAMACGTPVVNTTLDTGVPFVSLNEVTGFSVKPADDDALAGAINSLLYNPELRYRFGVAARERVLSVFAMTRMVGATVDVLRRAAGLEALTEHNMVRGAEC